MALNHEYEPEGEPELDIIEVLEESDGPMRPRDIADETGRSMSTNYQYIKRLNAAGVLYQPRPQMYDIRYKPWEMDDSELAALYRSLACDLDPDGSDQ